MKRLTKAEIRKYAEEMRNTKRPRVISEPHTIVVRVWFSEIAKFMDIAVNEVTSSYLRRLYKQDGVYHASTKEDYNVLRPHAIV